MINDLHIYHVIVKKKKRENIWWWCDYQGWERRMRQCRGTSEGFISIISRHHSWRSCFETVSTIQNSQICSCWPSLHHRHTAKSHWSEMLRGEPCLRTYWLFSVLYWWSSRHILQALHSKVPDWVSDDEHAVPRPLVLHFHFRSTLQLNSNECASAI